MSKRWRWVSCQPIAAPIARCSPPSVIVPGTSSRRQIGGLGPRSVTFRLTMVVPASFLGTLVLAMILASCRQRTSATMPITVFCAMTLLTASGLWWADGQGPAVQGQADGLKERDAASSGGLEHRPDVGIESGAPFAAETVGDLAEGDAGSKRPFGTVVGRRDGAVGHEDEQVAADLLDHALQFNAGACRRRAAHEVVEAALQAGRVSSQRRVGEPFPSLADAAGAPEQMAQSGRKEAVAVVDGVLHVADEMGEADLVLLRRKSQLGAVAVGDPEVGAVFAQEGLRHAFATRGLDHEDSVVLVVEDPQPPVPLADPEAGLVRFHRGSRQQARTDEACLPREGVTSRVEHVDEGACADVEAEEIGDQPRQPREGDALGEAQIDDQCAQVWPERRSLRKSFRRRSLELPGATRAGSAEERNPRHVGLDRWDLDMIVGLARDLHLA